VRDAIRVAFYIVSPRCLRPHLLTVDREDVERVRGGKLDESASSERSFQSQLDPRKLTPELLSGSFRPVSLGGNFRIPTSIRVFYTCPAISLASFARGLCVCARVDEEHIASSPRGGCGKINSNSSRRHRLCRATGPRIGRWRERRSGSMLNRRRARRGARSKGALLSE